MTQMIAYSSYRFHMRRMLHLYDSSLNILVIDSIDLSAGDETVLGLRRVWWKLGVSDGLIHKIGVELGVWWGCALIGATSEGFLLFFSFLDWFLVAVNRVDVLMEVMSGDLLVFVVWWSVRYLVSRVEGFFDDI